MASDAIADARDRLDDGRVAELAPQGHDAHAHGVGERVGVLVPDALEQLLGRDGLAVGRQQRLEDAELLRRQVEVGARRA